MVYPARIYEIRGVWYLDSDVLLYSGIEEIHAAYSTGLTECGFLIPRQEFTSFEWGDHAHASYWTETALAKFSEFAVRKFQEREYLALYEEK